MRSTVLWVLSLLAPLTAQGGDILADALQASRLSGYGKIMFIADDKKGGRLNQNTPGIGGKLGVETGNFYGFSLKGAAYTTQDLGLRSDNPRETDAYMFDLDKTPYSLLGEAQVGFTAGKTTLTLGRQEFFSPIIDSYEYRIIPNLFEAYTLKNLDLPNTTLTLAYVTKMSGLDGLVTFSEFRSMSQQTYTSLIINAAGVIDTGSGETLDPSRVVGQRGVWVTGLVFEPGDLIRLWNFHGTDTLNTLYLDGRLKRRLSENLALTLEAQAYRVAAVGSFKGFLAQQGLNASYGLDGSKATLAYKPAGLSISIAHNHFSGNERTVTSFGNWGGYPEFVSMPYLFAENNGSSAIARSRLSKLTAVLDLGAYGLPDHGLILGHAHVNTDQAIIANTDIVVNSLIYRSKLGRGWSTRAAFEWRNSANSRYDNEFIALSLLYYILNRPIKRYRITSVEHCEHSKGSYGPSSSVAASEV
jgi:hypothetical protein